MGFVGNVRNLRNWIWALVTAMCVALAMGAAAQQQGNAGGRPPGWAYPGKQSEPVDVSAGGNGEMVRVPGSAQAFTMAQIADPFFAVDWHPAEHPPMPEVVAYGRKPDVKACGTCHLPNGGGRRGNASLAGLPAAYIAEQIADFKSGARKSYVPEFSAEMIAIAKAMNDGEVKSAAGYFSGLTMISRVQVSQTDLDAKGQVIDEQPEKMNAARDQVRNEDSRYIAYVPAGSIQRGEALVAGGGGAKRTPCADCHGTSLSGAGTVPGIVGRSPSYIVRQLYDIQSGARSGPSVKWMQAAVAQLSVDDMVAIAAYLSSREIPAAARTTATVDMGVLVAQGKASFDGYGCYDCHGPKGEGSVEGPSLIESKLNAEEVAKALKNPSADARARGMPVIPADSPDLQGLVAYVMSLKR